LGKETGICSLDATQPRFGCKLFKNIFLKLPAKKAGEQAKATLRQQNVKCDFLVDFLPMFPYLGICCCRQSI
jgi:hypothetical protein